MVCLIKFAKICDFYHMKSLKFCDIISMKSQKGEWLDVCGRKFGIVRHSWRV